MERLSVFGLHLKLINITVRFIIFVGRMIVFIFFIFRDRKMGKFFYTRIMVIKKRRWCLISMIFLLLIRRNLKVAEVWQLKHKN